MAAVAIRVRGREGVVVVDVAGGAESGCVNAGERPPGGAVVKRRGVPRNRRVAG